MVVGESALQREVHALYSDHHGETECEKKTQNAVINRDLRAPAATK